MGSTLTNTQPKDTYKSLLKTSDSSELSATAKYVSDGNGNDSTLALSTNNVGIGTIAPDIFSRFYARTVGIDSSGITKIQLNGTTYSGIDMGQGGTRYAELNTSSLGLDVATIGALPIRFYPNGGNRVSITTDGLTFNGDTAAANALDDYEEGTWTPVLRQGGINNTVTYSFQGGSYTKVGNLVTVFFDVDTTSITAGSGVCEIGGLPYSSGSSMAGYSYVSLRDPSALVGTVANSIFTGFVQRPAAYLVLRTLSATTGAEGACSSWNSFGRVTGVAQYTV